VRAIEGEWIHVVSSIVDQQDQNIFLSSHLLSSSPVVAFIPCWYHSNERSGYMDIDRRLRYRRLDLDLLYASVTGCMAARAQSSTGGMGGRKRNKRKSAPI
jgi:hypothetical protein